MHQCGDRLAHLVHHTMSHARDNGAQGALDEGKEMPEEMRKRPGMSPGIEQGSISG